MLIVVTINQIAGIHLLLVMNVDFNYNYIYLIITTLIVTTLLMNHLFVLECQG